MRTSYIIVKTFNKQSLLNSVCIGAGENSAQYPNNSIRYTSTSTNINSTREIPSGKFDHSS